MMAFYRSINGELEVELVSADLTGALRCLAEAGIHVYDVCLAGDLSIRFRIRRGDFRKLRKLVDKRGDCLQILRYYGAYWTAKGLLNRPVLLCGLLLVILLTAFIPGKVYFVQVEGNAFVPERLIVSAAEECGIVFGATRREVRSERVKNGILSAIPELQWAGVNTKGCVAVISVREKTMPDKDGNVPTVSSIVAVCDGVVVSATAQQGDLQCRVGQVVEAGEVLVSGYKDCGLTVQATRAVGEVFAQTRRMLEAVTPAECIQKGEVTGSEKKYSLIIGKKRINFYKDSGILGTTCDKMSTVNYMTLPGGFVLPVALVTEQWIRYDCQTEAVSQNRAEIILKDFAQEYLYRQMIAGQLLQRSEIISSGDDCCRLLGKYACHEMIGRERSEENLGDYGKSN